MTFLVEEAQKEYNCGVEKARGLLLTEGKKKERIKPLGKAMSLDIRLLSCEKCILARNLNFVPKEIVGIVKHVVMQLMRSRTRTKIEMMKHVCRFCASLSTTMESRNTH